MSALDAVMLAELRDLGGGDEFLVELFDTWTVQVHELIERLHGALAAGDRVAFRRTAHTIAGSSLNVGAAAVAQACRSAEAALAHDAAVPEPQHLAQVEAEVHRAVRAMAIYALQCA